MKNTYKIPEGCTSISIEQIGNKIVTEFIPSCKFKDGDVIFEDGRIIIYKSHIGSESFNTHALIYYSIDKEVSYGGYYGESVESCRMATKKEKQLLFDALSKVSKKWNAETLQIEDLKVDPKVGDCVKIGSAYCIVGQVCGDAFSEKNEWIRFEWDGYKIKQKSYIKFTKYADIAILTPPQFQSEVNALGFEYDFKNDTFKEMRWVPKEGEKFWCVYFTFIPYSCTNDGESIDKELIKVGNCFKTKSECESAIEKIKNVLKSK